MHFSGQDKNSQVDWTLFNSEECLRNFEGKSEFLRLIEAQKREVSYGEVYLKNLNFWKFTQKKNVPVFLKKAKWTRSKEKIFLEISGIVTEMCYSFRWKTNRKNLVLMIVLIAVKYAKKWRNRAVCHCYR